MVQTKLCIVTHTFLPHIGGIERVVYEQSKRLLERQYDLMVLTNRIGTGKNYTYDGIEVKCYESLNLGFRMGIPYPVPSISSFKIFLNSVKSSCLVHAHGHPYMSSLIAAKLAKRYKKPLIVTQHNTFIEYNNIWDTVERLNDLAIGKQVLKEADKIVAVSNATRNYVLALGVDAEKVKVLHNGVDVKRFKPNAQLREETRKKLQIQEDEIAVLTVRRLVYKNGIDTFIQAAAKAVQKNRNLVFLVIGTGPDFSEVKAEIEHLGIGRNFRVTGFVSDTDLPAYYNAADFFVLPSKSGEGLPLVGLEAMACGLPLVATAVGGIAEIVIKDFGKIVPPDSPQEMAETIIEFSQKKLPDLRAKIREAAVQRHSWDKNIDSMIKIYEEFI